MSHGDHFLTQAYKNARIRSFQIQKNYFKYGIERDDAGYDEEGYDEDGYDRDGLDRDGYDRNGVFDPVMYHACARGKEYIRQERSLAQIAVNPDGRDDFGYDLDGYDREGYDRNGLDRNFCNRRGEYLYDR